MQTSFFRLLLTGAAALAVIAAPVYAQDETDIDFGDDSGSWPFDDECDDPRFEGEGVVSGSSRDNVGKDATDCRALFEKGQIRYSDVQFDPELVVVNGTNLGDDSYEWANDGQCDDARFIGDGMATTPSLDAIERDRSDCSYGFQLGSLTLATELPEPPETVYDGIDFGHDKGSYVADGECDDPRFSGAGMATIATETTNVGADRKDCLAAYKAGSIVLKANFIIDGFFFGDDANLYPEDGECDDPRFTGAGMASKPTLAGLKHDATDCMAAWRADRIQPNPLLDSGGILIKNGILFGDDSGQFANDGECDDPTFTGRDMADGGGSAENIGKDRSDCANAYDRGTIKVASLTPVVQDITVDGIRFGDDESPFARDGECDDPRFEGSAMASTLRSEDARHDATDCLAAYQAGSIALKP